MSNVIKYYIKKAEFENFRNMPDRINITKIC